jgi:serine protease
VYKRQADVRTNGGDLFAAAPLFASSRGDITGDFVFCGYGKAEEIPASVAGRIAVIRRGAQVPFGDKTRNALAAGAKAVIILNGKDDTERIDNWTLIRKICEGLACQDNPADLGFPWPVAIAMSYSEGEKLLALIGKAAITESYRADDFTRMSGTSMAAPHVSATAALVWSVDPTLTAVDIRRVIETTAEDKGAPGTDNWFGHGVIDALAAAQRIAPQKFGLTPVPPHRRATGH